MIRVAIAEDLPRVADALKEKVELAPEIKVEMMAANGRELIRALHKNHNIDVLLMDIHMPEMNGIEATEEISRRWPQIKIIISTVFSDEQHLFDAVMAGAIGYLMKDEPPQKIHKAIYEALEGGAPMSKEVAAKALRLIKQGRPKPRRNLAEEYKLSKREIEILEHLSKGNTYEQIADNLYISYGTVRKHIENCYRKLRVHSKLEAINKIRDADI